MFTRWVGANRPLKQMLDKGEFQDSESPPLFFTEAFKLLKFQGRRYEQFRHTT